MPDFECVDSNMINYTEQIINKQRLVFAGSAGCDIVAGLCAHVLRHTGRPFDYFAHGSVVIHDPKSPVALIVPGDQPDNHGNAAFRNFNHHFAILCSMEFNPANGYSSESEYKRQYDQLADATPKGGLISFCEQDPVSSVICNKERADVAYVPFKMPDFKEDQGKYFLKDTGNNLIEIQPGEKSNILYFGAAREILKKIGVSSEQFFQAIGTYRPT